MALLKRKRSESEFSCSSSSTLSSPLRPDMSNMGFSDMMTERGMVEPIPYGRAPPHLPSRTMKRFRNNRPSDQQVHENTLSKLYSARQQESSTIHNIITSPNPAPSPSATSTAQRSLHAFWNISAPSPINTAPPSPVNKAAVSLVNAHTSCEDCGAAFHVGGEDDEMMDLDVPLYGAACARICAVCEKPVCGSCSVSVLGVEPRCLLCAGRDLPTAAQRKQRIYWESLRHFRDGQDQ